MKKMTFMTLVNGYDLLKWMVNYYFFSNIIKSSSTFGSLTSMEASIEVELVLSFDDLANLSNNHVIPIVAPIVPVIVRSLSGVVIA